MTSYQSGLFAEFLAKMYLRFRGFTILKSRHITGKHTGRAEIDIIAKRKNLIIFTEVKKRKSLDTAVDAITPSQAVRLRRAAELYLIKIGWTGEARFDMICVSNWKIRWIKSCI